MRYAKSGLLTGLVAFAFASSAHAQFWSDDFESYAAGSALEGQGGWHGWDGTNTGFALVNSVQARSGANSVLMSDGADSVQEWAGVTSGTWVFLGHIWVPSAYDGDFSYMIMNSYTDFGPYEWGSWVQFDGASGMVDCNCGGFGAGTAPIVYDQWVEIRKVIDLTNDSAEVFYDGVSMATYQWTGGYNGSQGHLVPGIQAIDLFPDPAVGTGAAPPYIDDLALYEVPDSLGTSYCGPAVPNSSANAGVITADGDLGAAANDVTLTATGLPPGQFGYFLAGQSMGFFNPPGSQGFICLSGNIGRYNSPSDIISGPSGSITIDTNNVPVNPSQPILPGETWLFQCWYRDVNPAPTSNFTDGRSITFL